MYCRHDLMEGQSYLGSLFWPGVEAGVVDAEVAVLADDEVLVLLGLTAHQARLAVVARPAVPHEVLHQVGAVDAAGRVHGVAAAEAAVEKDIEPLELRQFKSGRPKVRERRNAGYVTGPILVCGRCLLLGQCQQMPTNQSERPVPTLYCAVLLLWSS